MYDSLHQKSAFYAFVKEVTGKAPEGQLFDLDGLLQLPCQERVAHRQDESGNVSENIDTVLAVKEQKVEKYGRSPVEGLQHSPLKI